MNLVFNPDAFALGLAAGVIGLVLLLSLIVSYAYDESTLLCLGLYLIVMATLLVAGGRFPAPQELVQRMLLVVGPALITVLQLWVLRNRQSSGSDKLVMGLFGLLTLTLLGFQGAGASPLVVMIACGVWFLALTASSVYLGLESWRSAGPWKWWLLLGHGLGLLLAMAFLTEAIDANQTYLPVVLMVLLQAPPVYLSLVWRSRLLNELRLRGAAANVVDPLTGLSTTPVLVERLMRAMSSSHQGKTSSAIFLIQVQNWNGLLNELGQDFNEKLLLESALRLRRSIGDNDLVARISGNRFAVIAQGLANEHEVTSLATRLVVSGLRIDSPLLPGVELQFRVIVSNLRFSTPLTLAGAQDWLAALAARFDAWPGSHRNRSILAVTNAASAAAAEPVDTVRLDLNL